MASIAAGGKYSVVSIGGDGCSVASTAAPAGPVVSTVAAVAAPGPAVSPPIAANPTGVPSPAGLDVAAEWWAAAVFEGTYEGKLGSH